MENPDQPNSPVPKQFPPGGMRMMQWPIIALLFFLLTLIPMPPQYQSLLVKLGNATAAGYLGYWLDRIAMANQNMDADAGWRRMSRALLISACIVGVGIGS